MRSWIFDSSSCNAAYGKSTRTFPSRTSIASPMASAEASRRRSNAWSAVATAARLVNHALAMSSATSGISNQRSSCRRKLSIGFEDIAEATQGHYRNASRVEMLAQAVDVDLDNVGAGRRVHREHAFVQQRLADHLAHSHQQHLQDGVLLRTELQATTLDPEQTAAAFVLERPQADRWRAHSVG